MKLAIFVHDLSINIGHCRAMLETLSRSKHRYDEVTFISYNFDDKEYIQKLIPNSTFHKIPIPAFRPFIIKAMIYHLYTLFMALTSLRSHIKISIGIASIISDIVNIQFIHRSYCDHYFNVKSGNYLKVIYKKILFFYYDFCESLSYNKKKYYLTLSRFTSQEMIDLFQIPPEQIFMEYSGVNVEEFYPIVKERSEILQSLNQDYPELKKLDVTKAIFLFIGAFERKGLDTVLKQIEDRQLIIIGKPEGKSNYDFQNNHNIISINFTKKVNEFYNLADHFLFPTRYEPFGLVLIEAAASGMIVHTTRKQVGASEVIKNLPKVYTYNTASDFTINNEEVLSLHERNKLSTRRKKELQSLSWEKTACVFDKIINSFLPHDKEELTIKQSR